MTNNALSSPVVFKAGSNKSFKDRVAQGLAAVRQFRDMKVVADAEILAPRLVEFATACGSVLARSHARSGDSTAINAYIGKGRKFDEALGILAVAYAEQTALDHQQLLTVVNAGTIPSAPGW